MATEYDRIEEINKNIESKLDKSLKIQHGIYERVGCLPLALIVGSIAIVTTCNHSVATYKELKKMNKTNQSIIEGLVKRIDGLENEQSELYNRLNENNYTSAEAVEGDK